DAKGFGQVTSGRDRHGPKLPGDSPAPQPFHSPLAAGRLVPGASDTRHGLPENAKSRFRPAAPGPRRFRRVSSAIVDACPSLPPTGGKGHSCQKRISFFLLRNRTSRNNDLDGGTAFLSLIHDNVPVSIHVGEFLDVTGRPADAQVIDARVALKTKMD